MIKVLCITEKTPEQIKVNNVYYIDILSLYGGIDGTWFANVYEKQSEDCYTFVGNLHLKYFKTI